MAHRDGDGIAEEGELFCTHIGGSATLEGVMMRGKLNWAVAVRCEDGSMYVEEHDLPDRNARPAWMRWPIVRGCISFGESMVLAYRAMDIAAAHAFEDEEDEAGRQADGAGRQADGAGRQADGAGRQADGAGRQVDGADGQEDGSDGAGAGAGDASGDDAATANPESQGMGGGMILAVVVGVVLGVALFMGLPLVLTNLLVGELTADNSLLWNVVEACLRIAVLVAYIGGMGLMPDMARLYGYHGAEHQSIHCFEHGLPLTPENAARFSRLHVRCGTAFLVMTVGVALILHAVVPVGAWAEALGLTGIVRSLFVFASRLVMLPIVAGLSYEVTVTWAGKHPENPLVKIALWPGLQMQRLTTRRADDGMLECAIEALKRVDARERA